MPHLFLSSELNMSILPNHTVYNIVIKIPTIACYLMALDISKY